MKILLASASPRRVEILKAAGFDVDVRPAEVDETTRDGESPDAYVRRLAEAKAQAAAARAPNRVVLAADTVVVVGGEILGKPKDASDARRMLRLLSGRTHEVMTSVCLVGPAKAGHDDSPAETRLSLGGTIRTKVADTKVEFAPLTDAEIDWYVASGEGLDKAGAYAIQGLASRFVTRIDGSYSNVVGLPVALFYELCREEGIQVS